MHSRFIKVFLFLFLLCMFSSTSYALDFTVADVRGIGNYFDSDDSFYLANSTNIEHWSTSGSRLYTGEVTGFPAVVSDVLGYGDYVYVTLVNGIAYRISPSDSSRTFTSLVAGVDYNSLGDFSAGSSYRNCIYVDSTDDIFVSVAYEQKIVKIQGDTLSSADYYNLYYPMCLYVADDGLYTASFNTTDGSKPLFLVTGQYTVLFSLTLVLGLLPMVFLAFQNLLTVIM